MIGKETIAFNDRTGIAGDFLEKLLDFYFKLQARTRNGKRHPPKSKPDQSQLNLVE